MSEIAVDREAMDVLIARHLDASEHLGDSLGSLPASLDGGIATTLMGYLVTAGFDGSAVVADAQAMLAAVVVEVLDGFHANETSAEQTFADLQKALDQP